MRCPAGSRGRPGLPVGCGAQGQASVLSRGSHAGDAELLPGFGGGLSPPRPPPKAGHCGSSRPRVGRGGDNRSPSPAAARGRARGQQATPEPRAGIKRKKNQIHPGEHNSSPPKAGVSREAQAPSTPPRAQPSPGTFTEGCRWTGSSGEQGAEPPRSLRRWPPLWVSAGDPGRTTQPQPEGSRARRRPS